MYLMVEFFKNEVLFDYRLAPNDFAPGSEIQMNPYTNEND